METLGYTVIFMGVLAFLISAIGVLRMPDVFTRIHAGTKASTIGIFLVLIGASIIEPAWSFKLLLLLIFIFLTNPLSSSVIARAKHHEDMK